MPYTVAHATSESAPTDAVMIAGGGKTAATNLWDLAATYWRLDHNKEQWFHFGGPVHPHPDTHINNVGVMVVARSANAEQLGSYTAEMKVGASASYLGVPENFVDSSAFYPRISWFGESNLVTGEFWQWADLNTLQAGLIAQDPNAPAITPLYDGPIDCTYMAIVIDYGRKFEPCPRCCCCCLCFHPTIVVTEGFVSLIIDGEGSEPYRNPRACTKLDLSDEHPDGSPCLFTNDAEESAQPNPPGGKFIGTDAHGKYWFLDAASIVAGNILADGCTGIQISFSIYDDRDGHVPFLVGITVLVAPDLIQCVPYHLSCGNSADSTVSIFSLGLLNECGDYVDHGGVNSVFRDFCDGNIFITCDPDFDYETCRGHDLTSGSGSGLCP